MKPPPLKQVRLITFALAACMIYRNLRLCLRLRGLPMPFKNAGSDSDIIRLIIRVRRRDSIANIKLGRCL